MKRAPSFPKLVVVPVDRLKLRPEARDRRPDARLKETAGAAAVLAPPLVRPTAGGMFEVLSGARRVRALVEQGAREVTVLVFEGVDDEAAEILAIVANDHEPVPALRRIREAQRYRDWYRRKFPETSRIGRPPKGSHRANVPRFSDSLAMATGQHPGSIYRLCEIADRLSPSVDKVVHGTWLADRLVNLRALSRLPPERQVAVAREVKDGAPGPKTALRRALVRQQPGTVLDDDACRLQLGDAIEIMGSTVPAESCDLVLTDPPWGSAGFDPTQDGFGRAVHRVLKPGGKLLMVLGADYDPALYRTLDASGLTLVTRLVLVTTRRVSPSEKQRVMARHYPVLVYEKRDERVRGRGSARAGRADEMWGSVIYDEATWGEASENGSFAWAKGEAAIRELVDRYSLPGDTVLDPYAGSGTTLVAAKRLARYSIGIDVDPVAYRLAQRRVAAADWNDPDARIERREDRSYRDSSGRVIEQMLDS